MSLELKNLGYNDITIFEKLGRVGGKSYDINLKGAPYPMGTIFDNVVPQARRYGAAYARCWNVDRE